MQSLSFFLQKKQYADISSSEQMEKKKKKLCATLDKICNPLSRNNRNLYGYQKTHDEFVFQEGTRS